MLSVESRKYGGVDQFDLFWEVNKRLMASGEPFRSIPYRIYQVYSIESSSCSMHDNYSKTQPWS